MSAPVRTLDTLDLPTRLHRRYVEPNARRRTVDNPRMLRGFTPRGRGSVVRGAVAANWAEWAE
jgi:hypothetical protein